MADKTPRKKVPLDGDWMDVEVRGSDYREGSELHRLAKAVEEDDRRIAEYARKYREQNPDPAA